MGNNRFERQGGDMNELSQVLEVVRKKKGFGGRHYPLPIGREYGSIIDWPAQEPGDDLPDRLGEHA